MSLLQSTVLLGLAWFAAMNAMTSAAVWVLARLASQAVQRSSRRMVLALRLAPAAAAGAVALAFLPAHWRLEPLGLEETFGVVVRGLALLGGVLLVRSGWRVAMVAVAAWRVRASRRALSADPVTGAFCVDGFRGLALAGLFRPRVYVGRAVRAALTPAELDVALAHERAHLQAADNLTRMAIACAPDLFGWSKVARSLEARWRAEAECAADARAVMGNETRAVDLASALVKVARLADESEGALSCPAWSAFHEPALLDRRVRRLLDGAARLPDEPRTAGQLALLLVALGIAAHPIGIQLHRLAEVAVRILP